METAKKIIFYILGILALFILHIFVVSFLPPPLNHINVIIVALGWLLLHRDLGVALWTTAAIGFVMELYSSAPFGLQMLALLSSITLVQWLLITVFSNHSALVAALTGLVAGIAYRGMLFLLVSAISFFTRQQLVYGGGDGLDYMLEFILTTGVLVASFMITRRLRQRLNPRYVAIENT